VKVFRCGLRQKRGQSGAVLRFVGAPWDLAAMRWKAKAAKNLCGDPKANGFQEPALLHQLLVIWPDAIAPMCAYQIDSGRPGVACSTFLGRPAQSLDYRRSSAAPTRKWWIR